MGSRQDVTHLHIWMMNDDYNVPPQSTYEHFMGGHLRMKLHFLWKIFLKPRSIRTGLTYIVSAGGTVSATGATGAVALRPASKGMDLEFEGGLFDNRSTGPHPKFFPASLPLISGTISRGHNHLPTTIFQGARC